MAEAKTNAMRMLERAKISYRVHVYGHADGKIDGVSVAEKLGQDVDAVYKTLVTRGASGGNFVFVIPVAKELDLKKAAKAVGEKSVVREGRRAGDVHAGGDEEALPHGVRQGGGIAPGGLRERRADRLPDRGFAGRPAAARPGENRADHCGLKGLI